jgi:ferredoxin-NADP reductase
MSMLRHREAAGASVGARLVYSSRSWDDVIYRDELQRLSGGSNGPEVFHTLTRSQPPGWTGYARRVDGAMLSETAWPASSSPTAFICGPTPFVESVASALVLLGYPATSVKTERFGPTGG